MTVPNAGNLLTWDVGLWDAKSTVRSVTPQGRRTKMQRPPDLLTTEEEKQLAEMIEVDIDVALHPEPIHEIVQDNEEEN